MEALYINVNDVAVRQLIGDRAIASGARQKWASRFADSKGAIFFNTTQNSFGYVSVDGIGVGHKQASIDEFLKAIDGFIPPQPPITVAVNGTNIEVLFRPDNYDGIQVGCTKIPTATVDEIYKRLHEAK